MKRVLVTAAIALGFVAASAASASADGTHWEVVQDGAIWGVAPATADDGSSWNVNPSDIGSSDDGATWSSPPVETSGWQMDGTNWI